MPVADPMRGLTAVTEHDLSLHLAKAVLADRFLYCPALGWMEWDGQLWHRHDDREGIPVKRAIRYYIADWLAAEAHNLNLVDAVALFGFLKATGLEKLEKGIKTVSGMTVDALTFDPDPMLLNTPSGVVDLRDGSLQPHDPSLRITRVTSASYEPGARHDDWDQALEALEDEETREWLQAYLGRGLIGDQGGCEFVPFLIGGGSNGKSLILGSVLRAVGGYGGMLADEVLAVQAHTAHLVRLMGMRLAVVEELADGHRLNMSRMKQITGTDKIIGRHLYRSPVEFDATHTLVVSTNFHPLVPETDHGTWRRLKAVPFPFEFPPDHTLKRRLYHGRAQQRAVLAWLVEGAMSEMPEPSKAMEVATADWRGSVDLIATFLDEHCDRDPDGRVSRKGLLERFNQYSRDQGNRTMSGRLFTERFRSHKIVREWEIGEGRTGEAREWTGLTLRVQMLRSQS